MGTLHASECPIVVMNGEEDMKSRQCRTHNRMSLWGVLLLAAALCGFYAPLSVATALYFGEATAELTIQSITGGTALGCSACTDTFFGADASGNASASATGFANINGNPTNLVAGDGLSLRAEASGSASPPGFAESFFEAFGALDFSNTGLSAITVTFRLVWTLNADASLADPTAEDAFAFAEIFVESSSETHVDQIVFSDALFGPSGLQSLSDDITFSFTIAAGGTDFLDVGLSADGFAEAIPEPGALPLIALALGGMGFFARRRKLS